MFIHVYIYESDWAWIFIHVSMYESKPAGILINESRSLVYERILPGMLSLSSVVRQFMAWYDFKVLYRKKVYCLVGFQSPVIIRKYIARNDFRIFFFKTVYGLVQRRISGSSILIKYIAWYEFRILCHKKV